MYSSGALSETPVLFEEEYSPEGSFLVPADDPGLMAELISSFLNE